MTGTAAGGPGLPLPAGVGTGVGTIGAGGATALTGGRIGGAMCSAKVGTSCEGSVPTVMRTLSRGAVVPGAKVVPYVSIPTSSPA